MRRPHVLISGALALLAGVALAASPATKSGDIDPLGYQDAMWGMTKAQVKQSFPEVAAWNESARSLLYAKLIAGVQCTITFQFDPPNRLSRVTIHPERRRKGKDVEFQRMAELWPVFREVLTDKYGAPSKLEYAIDEDNFATHTRRAVWVFPETVIMLQVEKADGKGGGWQPFLTYYSRLEALPAEPDRSLMKADAEKHL